MKNSRIHLSEDLWSEILCKLPVKSLVRFHLVSKSWLSLISDRGFSRLHLKNFKNNREETHLLVVHGGRRDIVVRCSDTFGTISETLINLGNDCLQETWEFVCSMDGLVLLKRIRVGPTSVKDLKVWKPSIRKFHEIPSLPATITSPDSPLVDVDIGLGYDPLANDYKHVKLILSKTNVHSVAVYSLGTGSWKIIPFQGKGSSCSEWHWDSVLAVQRSVKVYLRGSLYFMAHDAHDLSVQALVSFDLSSEVFSSIGLPVDPGFEYWTKLVLIDGGCSVALIDMNCPEASVWVLESSRDETESMCWTKRYSFCLEYRHQYLYVKKNGDVLTQRRCPDQTLMWDRVASYCPETDEYKILEEMKDSSYWIRHVSGYVESLTLLG